MFASPTVFLEFNLPNATTWFYFSLLLAIAIFFKFGRLFSIRNADVLVLFLLMPGMMIIQASRPSAAASPQHPAVQAAGLVGAGAAGFAGGLETYALERRETADAARWVWLGYLWLVLGSWIVFVRCLFDLALVQRPALAPNLNYGGLAWFGLTLMVCIAAVAFREPERATTAQAARSIEAMQAVQIKAGPESATVVEARRLVDPTPMMMRGFAVAGHLAVVLGLMLMGRIHFQDPTAGLAAAVFYLLLPYTGMFVREVNHVWPMAILVWALVAYRRPALAGFLLGLATGLFYYPVVLLPVWISFYWGRGWGRFLFFFFLSLALVLGGVAIAYSVRGQLQEFIRSALDVAGWQPWKAPPADLEGLWTGVHAAYRIPVFIAYAAFVIATAFWPMPKNLGHVLSLSSAVLIGTQFWYADQGGIYVLWYLPLLLMMVFRPNLEDRRPPLIRHETDWLSRARGLVVRSVRRVFRKPEMASTP